MSMSAPAPPDPVATANAQEGLNKKTAVYQAETNNVNQTTPYGSLDYTQTGTNPDGTPIFHANTTLNPAEQKLFDTSVATQQGVGNAANTLIGNLGPSLTHAPDLNNSALVNQMMGWGTQVMQPQINQEQSQLNSQLQNQGVPVGSEAWNNSQRGFAQNENQAYDNLFSSVEPTAYGQALSSYEAPIQTLGTLLGESQPGNVGSSLTQTPQEQIQPANYESLVQQNYQSQVQNYQDTMAGLFGLGTAAIKGLTGMGGNWASASDRRLKKDIARVGKLDDGTPIYRFRYKDGDDRAMRFGVMAQEVVDTHPDAVFEGQDGFLSVDYERLTDGFAEASHG